MPHDPKDHRRWVQGFLAPSPKRRKEGAVLYPRPATALAGLWDDSHGACLLYRRIAREDRIPGDVHRDQVLYRPVGIEDAAGYVAKMAEAILKGSRPGVYLSVGGGLIHVVPILWSHAAKALVVLLPDDLADLVAHAGIADIRGFAPVGDQRLNDLLT